MIRRGLAALALVAFVIVPAAAQTAAVQTPEQFFGFKIGADGELARYPKVVDYMQYLARTSDRVKFEELGKATMGAPYVLVTISSPANLARLDRLVAITKRLSDPRGLSEADAMKLVHEGRPFYLLFATIHSTELGNGQAIIEVAHRLATDDSPEIREILDNTVLLLVPSQNPDGQNLVIDYWYKEKGTGYSRAYPDLYHKYVGHDDNRDWFMFTQKETRLAVEKVQNVYHPQLTHDMHQQGAGGSRIFVPPFQDPYNPNISPIIAQEHIQIGEAMASALVDNGQAGVEFYSRYDMWTPARQYQCYHGQPRILTEIASVNIADPYVNPAGKDTPLGPQDALWNYPLPYRSGEWSLRQIVDYAETVAFAGLTHMAKYHDMWLSNFYKIQRSWVDRTAPPYAFVIPAGQRDPFETYELLDILHIGAVEIHRAKAAFTAGGQSYPAGSWVVKVAQPFGAFAKTMLEKQDYPDLREFPGGPPKQPYDVTGQTLGMLMGVDVKQIDQPFDADLELLPAVEPVTAPMPARPKWGYLVGPESNAGFLALAKLQQANVPVYRAAAGFESGGDSFAPGTWIVPPTAEATRVLGDVAKTTGLVVSGADRAPAVGAFRLKPGTRIGLWKGVGNMPGGWLKWIFEQYRLQPPGRLGRRLRRRPLREVQRHRPALGHEPRTHRQRPRPEAVRPGVGVGVRHRRGGLDQAGRLGAERRDVGGRRQRRRDRRRAARPARREGAARESAAVRPAAGREPADGARERRDPRAARRVPEPGRSDRDAAEPRRRSEQPVLLPGLAARERVRSGGPRRVRHAQGVAGVLRQRPGVPPAARLRGRRAGGRALPGRRPDPGERLAARRADAPRSGQRRGVPRGAGVRGDDRGAVHLPRADARHLQADVQRHVPGPVHEGDGGGDGEDEIEHCRFQIADCRLRGIGSRSAGPQAGLGKQRQREETLFNRQLAI